MTATDTSTYSFQRRSVVFVALLSLIGSLLVFGAPQGQASTNPVLVEMGPQNAACTTFYFNYVAADGSGATAYDYYRYCDTPATGAGPGNVSRQDTVDAGVRELKAQSLHISCSDPFDEPVYYPAGHANEGQLLGFTSNKGSDLDTWVVAPRDDNGTEKSDFAVLRKLGGTDNFNDCGNFPIPEEPEDEFGALSVTKVVTGDGATGDESFAFSVTCDDDPAITFDLPDANDSMTWTSDPYEVGTSCDVEETDADGAASTTVTVDGATVTPVDGVVTVDITEADRTYAVVYTNDFPAEDPDPGTLQVTKVVTGDGATGDESFAFSVTCEDDPAITFDLPDNGTWTWGPETYPAGTSCTVTETDADGAASTNVAVTGDPDASIDQNTRTAVVTVGEDVAVTVTFTNHFPATVVEPEQGFISATKVLAEGSEWPEDGTFTFVLYDGGEELDRGDATDEVRTVTFDPVDAGTYTVCEEGLDDHWELIGVTVGGDPVADEDGCVDVTVGEAETVAVVFTNEFDEPFVPGGIIIELVKTNDADGDGTFTSSETAPEEGADVDFQLLIMNTNGTDVVVDGLTDSFSDITIDLLVGTVSPVGAGTLVDNTCAVLTGVVIPAGGSAACTFTLEDYAPAPGAENARTNTARVDVHEDGNTDNTANDSDTSTVDTAVPVVVEQNPAIELVKVADVEEAEVGDVITYTYTVTNTGDVTLTDITLDDDVLGEIELESTTLEPGETTTGTATHTVTEADLQAGEVVNVAIATGWPPEGEAVTDTDDETVNVFEEAVLPRVIEPAPAQESLPKTGAGLLALLVWALTALGLGAGTLGTVPRNRRMTT